ncbi:MAG: hypothetical protein HFH68_11490 [Lachnospiraceae bacterium]|nr:hypothetical protein [Lachnospiraceae bacterium]
MIKNLKLIKYGYQFRLNIICSFVFMLLGIFSIIYVDIYKVPSICIFIYCSFLFFLQTGSTLTYSNVIKSSPKYREFYMGLQRIINISSFVYSVGLLLIVRIIQADNISQFAGNMGKELVVAGMEYFIIVLYMVFAYKFFVVSMVLFCAATVLMNAAVSFIFAPYNFTLLQGIGIIALFFILTITLSEIITRAIYKVQPSRLAQSASLRGYI